MLLLPLFFAWLFSRDQLRKHLLLIEQVNQPIFYLNPLIADFFDKIECSEIAFNLFIPLKNFIGQGIKAFTKFPTLYTYFF